ncbi:hypothetical protein JW756_01500 [Candidatus Woesearchaeota archaeon]|nr:hypothetical protein [Candidatus Woesearchaeota archaeon]
MLGWIRKRIRLEQMNSGLTDAFAKIREDFSSQKKLLEELYINHHGFKQTTFLNHQRIADWIKHFDGSIRRLDQDLKVLEKKLDEEFEALSTASLNLFKEAYTKNIKDAQTIKKEILKEVEVFMNETRQKPKETNISNVNNVKAIMPEPFYDTLSNPEKWLVGVLFNAENPLSYNQIAERTGKTLSTIRVYMNQLKFKGFIDESTLPNGVKLFSLRHKAKVKKLYNL